ncbi:MAG TPA: C40 family peptidase [Candidatus Scybalomonas excrementigallinarum]|nr:C40 family peptidase [Candidatus Scybalomonas excrementigallinarum]
MKRRIMGLITGTAICLTMGASLLNPVQAQAAKKTAVTAEIEIPIEVEVDTEAILRDDMVSYALQFVGNPYVYGGTSLTNGTDCSGFTMGIYKNFGMSISRTSREQATNGKSIKSSELKKGDLVFYASGGRINHVAMYIGNGKIVHASNSRTGIIVSNMNYRTPYKYVSIIK